MGIVAVSAYPSMGACLLKQGRRENGLHEDGGDNRGGPAAIALQAVAAQAFATQRSSFCGPETSSRGLWRIELVESCTSTAVASTSACCSPVSWPCSMLTDSCRFNAGAARHRMLSWNGPAINFSTVIWKTPGRAWSGVFPTALLHRPRGPHCWRRSIGGAKQCIFLPSDA